MDDSEPFVSSAAAADALRQAGVSQYVMTLGDYIDNHESLDIAGSKNQVFKSPYNKLGGVVPPIVGILPKGKLFKAKRLM